MRSFCAVALVVVASLLTVDCTQVQSKLTTSDYSVISNPQDARGLRTEAKYGDNNEERAIAIPSGLTNIFSKVKNWLSNFISKIKISFSEKKRLQSWLDQGKTPDEVFKILKLDTGTKGLLGKKNLRTWSVFMTMYNRKNPTKMVNMLGTLTKHYDNEAVAVLLESSRANKYTRPLANRLQTQQLVAWARNGLSTDVVFDLLRIGKGNVKTLAQNRALNVWVYYFRQMNNYDDWQPQVAKKLLTVYDDIPMAKAFAVAKDAPETKYMGSQLQRFQFKVWLANKQDPETILQKLKADTSTWSFNPNVDIYVSYSSFYQMYSKLSR